MNRLKAVGDRIDRLVENPFWAIVFVVVYFNALVFGFWGLYIAGAWIYALPSEWIALKVFAATSAAAFFTFVAMFGAGGPE